ncbi:hypothetical protein GCM10010096_34210 [Alcaligenes pakistanensis]|uniref:Uncharacterized protein n=1 Tax=Alcaligenes pakistanensis TaxID=1482717 RepID=A0A8H9M750_9BURK|nr:hypothetical protein GCM10010096_34210 [Alcaligenes pakistanensis]
MTGLSHVRGGWRIGFIQLIQGHLRPTSPSPTFIEQLITGRLKKVGGDVLDVGTRLIQQAYNGIVDSIFRVVMVILPPGPIAHQPAIMIEP